MAGREFNVVVPGGIAGTLLTSPSFCVGVQSAIITNRIHYYKASQIWPFGCQNKARLMWMDSASLILEYLDFIFTKKKKNGRKFNVALPLFMCHTLQPQSWVGCQYLQWEEVAWQKKPSMLCIQRSLLHERGGFKGKGVWGPLASFFVCFAHDRKWLILDKETYPAFFACHSLWVSTVNYV